MTEPSGQPISCLACDLASGRVRLPGGQIHRTQHWVVEHTVGPLNVGTLIVKPIRHVVHVADLTPEEASELGPLLEETAGVVSNLTAADQVYVCLWSHADRVPGHIHFVVQPVSTDDMDRFGAYGPALQMAMFEADELPDEFEVVAFARKAAGRFRDRS